MRKTKRRRRKELGIAAMLITAVFVLMWVIRPWKREAPKVVEAPATPKVRRLLDGMFVETGKENPPLAGVIVENMVEAQPISGIADAALVFEAVTEANITRFLAYFVLGEIHRGSTSGESPEVEPRRLDIGPVRSVRPYFLDWAAEFNTLFAHVGSSPAAYELLRKKGVAGVQDLDQWYDSQYFFTKAGRPKPHHLYTSMELLEQAHGKIYKGKAAGDSGAVPPRLGLWQFKNDAPPDLRGNVTDVRVEYAAPYKVQWLYDKFGNNYKRAQWGGTHKDVNGKEIIAKNIAVAFQEMKILDELGRKEFKTAGEGKGLVFQDGRVVVGKWKKPNQQERLRFYDVQDQEVEFNAGTTWVAIVPTGYGVKY